MALELARPRQTAADLAALPEDVRAELIDGAIYVTPSPSFGHQEVVIAIVGHLVEHAKRMHGGRVAVAPIDVHLPTGDVLQPDVVLIGPDRLHLIERVVRGAPSLVVEVVSPSNPERDRIVKRDVYARSGVPEYWLVDPAAKGVEVFRLEGERYRPSGWFVSGTVLTSPSMPGLSIPVDSLFPPR